MNFEIAGKIIRSARERRRAEMSLREIAKMAGISPSAMSQIEKGAIRPTVDVAIKIVLALGNLSVIELACLKNSWMEPDRLAVNKWRAL